VSISTRLATGCFGALVALASASPVLAQGLLSISTQPPGTINNVQAQALAKAIQEDSDLRTRVVTFNSAAAILGSAQNQQADFAFYSNDEAGAAIQGIQNYQGQRAMGDLRLIATIFPIDVGIMVRDDSDINTIADLKGRKFGTGWQGWTHGLYIVNGILANAGLSLDDVDPVPTANLLRGADDFKAGRTAGAMFAVGAPKVAEIDSSVGGVRFLSMDDSQKAVKRMQAVRPHYNVATVQPAPHRAGIKGPTNLMRYYMSLFAHKDTPDETVYEAVKALHGNKKALVAAHPSFNSFSPEQMSREHPGQEYHPGAIKFFKEAGIWNK
jgi:TRAP transporter TAXI family solute receptor